LESLSKTSFLFLFPDHGPGHPVEDGHAPAGHRVDVYAAQFRQEESGEQVRPGHRLDEGGATHATSCCKLGKQNEVRNELLLL